MERCFKGVANLLTKTRNFTDRIDVLLSLCIKVKFKKFT